MRIKSCQQLIQLAVYVQREPEAEKKLTQKDPHVYGLGPTRLNHRLHVADVSCTFSCLFVCLLLPLPSSRTFQ